MAQHKVMSTKAWLRAKQRLARNCLRASEAQQKQARASAAQRSFDGTLVRAVTLLIIMLACLTLGILVIIKVNGW